VLAYVPEPRRAAFVDVVRGLSRRWVGNQGPDVLHYGALPAQPTGALHNVLALGFGVCTAAAPKHTW
jgi:hypothetical protein